MPWIDDVLGEVKVAFNQLPKTPNDGHRRSTLIMLIALSLSELRRIDELRADDEEVLPEPAAPKPKPVPLLGFRQDFPLLLSDDQKGFKHPMFGISWDAVLPYGKQAISNHSQSLFRLAERGGLAATELFAVIKGYDIFDNKARVRNDEPKGAALEAYLRELNDEAVKARQLHVAAYPQQADVPIRSDQWLKSVPLEWIEAMDRAAKPSRSIADLFSVKVAELPDRGLWLDELCSFLVESPALPLNTPSQKRQAVYLIYQAWVTNQMLSSAKNEG